MSAFDGVSDATTLVPVHRYGIAELQAAYRNGAVTVREVVEAALARIAALNPKLHAFIEVDQDGARAGASESDRRFANGNVRPLEGITIAAKSNIAVAGLEWNAGMATRRGLIASEDAPVVAALRNAGAIILGTLNMHEAALGATTDNPWFGTALNPHGQQRTPGGSSGGSGAAVAAGLCVASLGTDTLGSVRIPAAYNGVYGLKPTHGALSDEGLAPMSKWLDMIGPIARSIDDLCAIWAALSPTAQPDIAFRRLITIPDLGGVKVEPAVADSYARALEALSALPATELNLPPLSTIRTAGFLDSTRELATHIGAARTDTPELMSSDLHWLLDYAERTDLDASLLPAVRTAIRETIGTDGVLLLPTAPQVAFAQGQRGPANQADFTALASVAGLPAITLPAGRDADNMPVGVQLVGPAGAESALLRLAADLDRSLGAYTPPPLF